MFCPCDLFRLTPNIVATAGLIRFRVETDPQHLWVGPESQAAQEKAAFEASFGPFYRVEQLILSTTPDSNSTYNSSDSGLPSIVTDANIRLLFAMQREVDELFGKPGCCQRSGAIGDGAGVLMV